MGFHFERRESVERGVHRIADERFTRAIVLLRGFGAPGHPAPHVAVHRVRTTVKELRGLLRLVEPALGRRWREIDGHLRAAAQVLAAARERDALLACHDGLAAGVEARGEPALVEACARWRCALDAELARAATDAAGDADANRALAAGALEQAREALACCVIPGTGFEAIAKGLGRSYARARAAFAEAVASEDIEHRHTWRKRAKVHWYHLRLLEPLWPAYVESLAAESKRLTEALGDERDLFTLAALARAHAAADLPRAYRDAIEERRAAALRRAHRLAARLFARRRRETVDHFAALWRVWRSGRGRSRAAPPE